MARDGELRRVEVGFSGGQAIAAAARRRRPTSSCGARVQDGRRLVRGRDAGRRWSRSTSAQVVFVKLDAAEHRVGFSGPLADAVARRHAPRGWPRLGDASAAALWWRKNPSACPYGQRFWVEAPHPGITRKRLLEALEPRPGERVLEIGPGTGYYTLDVAARARRRARSTIFDIQQEMLDHVMREAAERGVANIEPDARRRPARCRTTTTASTARSW